MAEKRFINGFVNDLKFDGCFRIAIKEDELLELIKESKSLGKKFVEIDFMLSKAGKRYLELNTFVSKGNDEEVPF